MKQAARLLAQVRSHRDEIATFLRLLASAESPSDAPASQGAVQALLGDALRRLGYRVRHLPGRRTGGHLFARPEHAVKGRPLQLLVGHTDTVWPIGTVSSMPVRTEDGCLYGPGTFDMKGGLTLVVFALRVLQELGLDPPATPVVFVNSDEELGSPESRRWVRMLARRAHRAFIVEPGLGPDGKLKTARKGVGQFEVTIEGKAAHAGLEPGAGASAIHELAIVVQSLHALNDPDRGISVNVGVVQGGIRPNVVAPRAHARVDARVVAAADGRWLETVIRGLSAVTPGVTVHVTGGFSIPPLERTKRNLRLWEVAHRAGRALDLELEDSLVGGGSDGNTTSQFTATLDGLGAIGDGAHAVHEHVVLEASVDRCALLALLLLQPVDPAGRASDS